MTAGHDPSGSASADSPLREGHTSRRQSPRVAESGDSEPLTLAHATEVTYTRPGPWCLLTVGEQCWSVAGWGVYRGRRTWLLRTRPVPASTTRVTLEGRRLDAVVISLRSQEVTPLARRRTTAVPSEMDFTRM